MRRVLLLRHTAVAAHHRGICYGQRDVGLGAEGFRAARELARAVPAESFQIIMASPLRRARWLGGLLARGGKRALVVEPSLAERDFGRWEGMGWDAVWAVEGDSMNGVLDAPDRYRPGGGETTAELGRRALAWFEALPADGSVLAVAHGGPIGALAGMLRGEAPRGWLAHVPREGEGLLIEHPAGAAPVISPWSARR
ncbi:histidine phosphatase family protein [Roseomonas harenae]|jgi:broad specificity phosphatase PhoE|uniref:histidine phosphatase family protein n=1 Tax=Muricoccus harenae TaxID=2692566 RepID=UPI001331B72B|nr:histidine phosphatase family protein [Roseomonas harenae]